METFLEFEDSKGKSIAEISVVIHIDFRLHKGDDLGFDISRFTQDREKFCENLECNADDVNHIADSIEATNNNWGWIIAGHSFLFSSDGSISQHATLRPKPSETKQASN